MKAVAALQHNSVGVRDNDFISSSIEKQGVYLLMGKHILIAEARAVLRLGLRAIFLDNPGVTEISEATTSEDLKKQLEQSMLDLVVIHQSLITDIEILPKGHCIILADEPNKNMLLAAHASGACGYLSESASAELLRMTLYLTEGEFLLDPSFTSWILDSVSSETLPSLTNEVLTAREQEIFYLLRAGLTYRSIADRLGISTTTVKTHVGHIFRKLDIKRRPGQGHAASSSMGVSHYPEKRSS